MKLTLKTSLLTCNKKSESWTGGLWWSYKMYMTVANDIETACSITDESREGMSNGFSKGNEQSR